jgi:hypothetical protein
MTVNRTDLLLALTLCAFVSGCHTTDDGSAVQPIEGAQNASIHILFDTTRPLPTGGTFGWGISLLRVDPAHKVLLSDVEERMHRAMLEMLPAEGFSYTNEAPDYLVGFAFMAGDSLDEAELNKAYGELLSFPERPASAPSLQYSTGVLVLDIVARGQGRLLWRGAIKADIDLQLPDEKKQTRCDDAVRELLRHYPAPPKR